MGKHNWINAIEKKTGRTITVHQLKPFSNTFIDQDGNIFLIEDIDMTEIRYAYERDADKKEVESGLDGYRAIYG